MILVINSIILLISCSNQPESGDKSIFRYNSASGISSLDPAFARTQENIRAVNQLFNGLIQLDHELKIKPGIAKSWNIDSTGLVYTFTIRNDVFFHKHHAFGPDSIRHVVAKDFVYSFERIMDPKVASDGAWIFNSTVSVENPFIALSDTQLQIRLAKPFNPFLGLLSMAYCSVVPREVVEATENRFGKSPIGTGPFKFANWKDGIRLNFIKNPRYFESSDSLQIPKLDAISISFIQNKQTELLLLRQGKLDVFSGLESSYKDDVLTASGDLREKYSQDFRLSVQAFLNTEFLAFNLESESFSRNKDFRMALNYAVNREAMVNYLRNNVGNAAFGGFTPLGLPGHQGSSKFEYSPEKAKYHLSQSPYVPGEALKLSTTKEYLDLCILVQKDLEKIGVILQIEVIPSALLRQQKSSGELEFFRGSWIADYPDAENYMACFFSGNRAPNGPNYCRYENSSFDSCYRLLLKSNAEESKLKLIRFMEELLLKNPPFILLFYDESFWIYSKKIDGLRINPLNHMDLRFTQKLD